jgi:hypothetical protein
VKIRRKATKVRGGKTKDALPLQILPNSGRNLKRPKIDAFVARVTALPVVDDTADRIE